jgi:dTMP kinase
MVIHDMNRSASAILRNFIVIEGLDGSGTTTQLRLLTASLTSHGVPVEPTCEPTGGPVGRLIRDILGKRETVEPATLARLFAADRAEHLEAPGHGIRALLAAGRLVLCDRYLFSSLAYQSLDVDFDVVHSLNEHFPLPEILIYIDTPVAVCAERRRSRETEELFEEIQVQERVARGYERALELFSDSPMRIERLDGLLPSEKIRDRIWTILSALPIVKG